MKTGLLNGALHSSYNQFGKCIFKIFSFLIIHTRDRTPSITCLHTKTLYYFKQSLAEHFIRSPKVMEEEIMTDINDLLQEFWTSSNGAVETSFFAMRSSCLLGILKICFDILMNDILVCFDVIIIIWRLLWS